uniref:Uncharacterized protein n=1 Tax=Anguilla anguilla TaxID=7936 RepID=A0A0E9Q5C6_ANGAN
MLKSSSTSDVCVKWWIIRDNGETCVGFKNDLSRLHL